MNDCGQFLLYDALLACFFVLIVVLAMLFVVGQGVFVYSDVDVAGDSLDLLSGMSVHGVPLLSALSVSDESAVSAACDVLSGRSFVLRDLSLNRTLLYDLSGDFDNEFSSRRVVGGHVYELTVFV